eukprot:TRINITY_DN3551_c0_g1_i1.p1 TRINITY_DN3551_c0_g1~~TRINITY_DN3551_c0_g1_i1.p1  ORF type:complete len:244 (+),score=37.09 TRINITY_DN3551_c0_g1_i1:373-1104(+)
MVIGDAIATLEASGDHLLAISCSGNLFLWNISQQKSQLSCSLLPIMENNPDISVIRARISPNLKPVVTLSNHFSFLYHSEMETWVRVADNKFPFSEYSTQMVIRNAREKVKGILSDVQLTSTLNPDQLRDAYDQKDLETIPHLENMMASALCLESQEDYKYWLRTYVQFLTGQSNEQKLHEICNFLLGPHLKNPSSWDPFILKLSKRDLLKELLPLMASNRTLQRLLTQLKAVSYTHLTLPTT